MVEEHKEENEELRTAKADGEREKPDKTGRGIERERERERDIARETERKREREREREAALLLFKTMTGNVAKDSHIVQQDTVQYIGFITDNSV